jgi:hypothetical protein
MDFHCAMNLVLGSAVSPIVRAPIPPEDRASRFVPGLSEVPQPPTSGNRRDIVFPRYSWQNKTK